MHARRRLRRGRGPPHRPGSLAATLSLSAPPARDRVPELGVYVHIPFCSRRCDYCAFATWDDRFELVDRYLSAVGREITRAVGAGLEPAGSIFVGGGTPSMLSPEQLATVLGQIPRLAGAEVTVECNPETIDADRLAGYRDAGVTRISVGVQSTQPHVLAALGRTHDVERAEDAVAAVAGAAFESWNVDVIYGAAGETVTDWRATVERVASWDPPHVSAYGLTVEPGTPLADDPSRHPDPDVQADCYLLAEELLTATGRNSYEISNWSRPGHECRQHLVYWSQGDYRGFGCSAHSHRDGRRWWNLRTPERYLDAMDAGDDPVAADEVLDADTRRLERLQLALRTSWGVPAGALDTEGIESLVEPIGDRVRLTVAGRLLANEVAMRLR